MPVSRKNGVLCPGHRRDWLFVSQKILLIVQAVFGTRHFKRRQKLASRKRDFSGVAENLSDHERVKIGRLDQLKHESGHPESVLRPSNVAIRSAVNFIVYASEFFLAFLM